MQMCLQVLPLLLAHSTSIDLLQQQGQLVQLPAQVLQQPGRTPFAGGKSAVIITSADGRASPIHLHQGSPKSEKVLGAGKRHSQSSMAQLSLCTSVRTLTKCPSPGAPHAHVACGPPEGKC